MSQNSISHTSSEMVCAFSFIMSSEVVLILIHVGVGVDKTMEELFADTCKKQMEYLWTLQIPGFNSELFLVSYKEETRLCGNIGEQSQAYPVLGYSPLRLSN